MFHLPKRNDSGKDTFIFGECYFFGSIHGSTVFSTTYTDVTNYCCCRINYALYEEIETKDVERTRDVYRYS